MAFGSKAGGGFSLAAGLRERKTFCMPQVQLPVFPDGTTLINSDLGCVRKGQQILYVNGHLPVFTHEVDDLASFRLITTQLIVNGTATQSQIVRAFGVPLRTVKRYCQKYHREGAAGFYKPAARRKGHRLTPERLTEVQAMLDQGQTPPQISRETGLLSSTVHKAIDDGRLKQIKKKSLNGAPNS